MKDKIIYFLYRYNLLRVILIKIMARNNYKQSKSKLLRKIFKDYHNIEVGLGSYGGCFNYKNINRNVKIGKYCSFAKDVYYFNANHPFDKFTTHPNIYSKEFKMVEDEGIKRSNLNIGNDVWLGQNTIILANVKNIGDGAVVAAGSIVTKDVPDYSIVAGVPAKVIRYRFDDEKIKVLKKLSWWEWSEEEISSAIKSTSNIDDFIEWGLKNVKK